MIYEFRTLSPDICDKVARTASKTDHRTTKGRVCRVLHFCHESQALPQGRAMEIDSTRLLDFPLKVRILDRSTREWIKRWFISKFLFFTRSIRKGRVKNRSRHGSKGGGGGKPRSCVYNAGINQLNYKLVYRSWAKRPPVEDRTGGARWVGGPWEEGVGGRLSRKFNLSPCDPRVDPPFIPRFPSLPSSWSLLLKVIYALLPVRAEGKLIADRLPSFDSIERNFRNHGSRPIRELERSSRGNLTSLTALRFEFQQRRSSRLPLRVERYVNEHNY